MNPSPNFKSLMKNPYSTARFVLSQAQLKSNLSVIQERARGARLIAMVKANAYGHGITEIVPVLENSGVHCFGVATLDEAILVRSLCPDSMVLVWAGTLADEFETLAAHRLTPVIHYLEQWFKWVEWCDSHGGAPVPVHLEIDTGMVRSGLIAGELDELLKTPFPKKVLLEAVTSHYFASESKDDSSERQYRTLKTYQDLIRGWSGQESLAIHSSNSGSLIQDRIHREESFVRPGIALYGYDPVSKNSPLVRPVGRLEARVLDVKLIPSGTGVSYNHTFRTKRKSLIATVGAGYGDGIPRALSNRGSIQVQGVRVPFVGNVCMDVMCLDVTDLPNPPDRGDWLTLFGTEGELREWADLTGTIVYEILCHLGQRVCRLWES